MSLSNATPFRILKLHLCSFPVESSVSDPFLRKKTCQGMQIFEKCQVVFYSRRPPCTVYSASAADDLIVDVVEHKIFSLHVN
eukprot:3249766-Pleurochrysis_carterae.AAC.2